MMNKFNIKTDMICMLKSSEEFCDQVTEANE